MRYMQCVYVLLLPCIVLYRSLLMLDVGSCLLLVFMIPTWCDMESSMWCTCCHDLSCYVLRSLCSMLMGYLGCHHVCLHWDPFYAMLARCSSCMSLCHIDRSLLTKSSCSEHLLNPLLRVGIFRWSRHHLLCTSSLLTTLNVAADTILTLGLEDVVLHGRTPLWTTYVLMLLMNVLFLFFTKCRCIH